MSDTEARGVLAVVIDINPVWWGQRVLDHQRELVLSQCLDAVTVFCNSYLLLTHQNKLAVFTAHSSSSTCVFPKPEVTVDDGSQDASMRGERDGKYELFAELDSLVVEQVKDSILNDHQAEVSTDSLVTGAMAQALCYIHRITREAEDGDSLSSRILVIKGAEDNSSQYLNLMNVIFTAQKQNVVIDACILDNESSLLQQACDITGGFYLRVPQLSGLLQYLLWVYLPEPALRSSLTLPQRTQVDYRAACFCHRTLVDVGYVCSVCLSIFCSFSPICQTCQTTFKFLGPTKGVKRKAKKS